jgi:hypothetical protein
VVERAVGGREALGAVDDQYFAHDVRL